MFKNGKLMGFAFLILLSLSLVLAAWQSADEHDQTTSFNACLRAGDDPRDCGEKIGLNR